MAKVTKIVKSPKANLKSLNDVEPQPKRSDTVEGLLEKVVKEQPISYEDVFKTRNRVIDDRSTPVPGSQVNSPAKSTVQLADDRPSSMEKQTFNSVQKSKKLQEVDGFLNSVYQQQRGTASASRVKTPDPDISKYSFYNSRLKTVPGEFGNGSRAPIDVVDQSPHTRASPKVVAWTQKDFSASEKLKSNTAAPVPTTPQLLNKEMTALALKGTTRNDTVRSETNSITDDAGEFVEMLKSSSQIMILPEVEAKFLDQYNLDSALLKQVSTKVDTLAKKIKDITRFIKSKIKVEEELLTPYAIRIQSWYRGCKCRKYLVQAKLPIYSRSRFYPNLQKANQAAIKIQTIWRGVSVRFKLGPSFQISLLKAVTRAQRIELKRITDIHDKEIQEIKVRLLSLNPKLEEDLTTENFAS